MDFLKDFIATIKEQSVERVTSIYTGTFIFSWLAVNWKVVMFVVFSKQEIEIKLEKYPLYFPSDELVSFLFLDPLFISLAIVISIPFLNAFANFIKILVNFSLGKFQGKFSGWVSPKEAKKLVERIGELESEHASLFINKDEEIKNLRKNYRELEYEISSMQVKHVEQQEKIRSEINNSIEAEKNRTKKVEIELNDLREKSLVKDSECENLKIQLADINKKYGEMHQVQMAEIQEHPQYKSLKLNQESNQSTINGLNKRLQEEKIIYEKGLNELKHIVGHGATIREEQFKKIIEQYESNLSFATSLLDQAQKNK